MSKQTAVDWLVQYLTVRGYINPPSSIGHVVIDKAIEQALAMEREQIIIAHESGYEVGYIDNGKDGLTYYNETYKK